VKIAKHSDKARIIDILTPAFASNQSVNYIVKQDAKRLDRIKALMAYCSDLAFMWGDVFLSENNQACALVLYPDQRKTTIRSIRWDIQLAFNCVGISNIKKTIDRERLIKHIQPKGRIAYLWFIGVTPSSQGKGGGSTLLQELIAHYIHEKRPLYLETSTIRNLPWYQRFGFDIYHEEDLSYHLYFLRRISQIPAQGK
jgi:ribosomal protein S18 acetylase RimI-like enzyme